MDIYHVRLGPQHCDKCGTRHPSGWDCVADSEARMASMLNAIKNAKVVRVARPLLTVQGKESEMSWSFYAQGKPATVVERTDAELNTKRCEGAEEDARQNVLSAIKILAAEGCNSECAVKVEASGCAYTENGVQTTNQLSLKFETISAK